MYLNINTHSCKEQTIEAVNLICHPGVSHILVKQIYYKDSLHLLKISDNIKRNGTNEFTLKIHGIELNGQQINRFPEAQLQLDAFPDLKKGWNY
jgi:hypothetical protein